MTVAGLRTVEPLLPLLGLVGFLVASMAVFGARCAILGRPRTPAIEARAASSPWKWCMEWWVWLWGPVERACVALNVAPSAITVASTALAVLAAAILARGHLCIGGWTYLFAASLDLVDGRVARAQGTASAAGAFLDSTLDRVAELAVFGALAVHFRASPTLYATLGAAAASLLVSYARARGESLGVITESRVGSMQRAERVVLTGAPCALAPLLDAAFGGGAGGFVVGSALAVLAAVTTVTAATRSYSVWAVLREREIRPQPAANVRWLDSVRSRGRLGP